MGRRTAGKEKPWQRTGNVQISTLNIKRPNGRTWMQAPNKAHVPRQQLEEGKNGTFAELPVYHDAAAFRLEKGLMDACSTGCFLPLRGASVAEAAEMLWRIAGKPEPGRTQEGLADAGDGAAHEKAALRARRCTQAWMEISGAERPETRAPRRIGRRTC